MEGRFLTTGPPGKSQVGTYFNINSIHTHSTTLFALILKNFINLFLYFCTMPVCENSPRDQTCALAVKAQIVNHWTTREVPTFLAFLINKSIRVQCSGGLSLPN